MAGQTGEHIPIINLFDTLIVTIQVELSDRLVLQLKDDIGAAIQKFGPTGLIIDVSGVEVIDSFISRAIRDVGLMSKLMGVRAVICGLDPNIAITLTEMGLDLEGVESHLHLESALEALQGDNPVLARISGGSEGPSREDWWWR